MPHIDRATDLLVAVCDGPTHARLGEKDGQHAAQPYVFIGLAMTVFARAKPRRCSLASRVDTPWGEPGGCARLACVPGIMVAVITVLSKPPRSDDFRRAQRDLEEFGRCSSLFAYWARHCEESARSMGANFYQVFIEGPVGPPIQVTPSFGDYLWSIPLNEFELVTTTPASGGYYQLRSAGQIWLNFWLGLLLDTTGRPNGLNKISIKLFAAESTASEIGHPTDPGRFASVMIDNTVPVVSIQQIDQQPGNVVVNTCAIVQTGTPTFTFQVTASAPQSHLMGWSLTAYWGDNKSISVSSDNYNNHITPTRLSGPALPESPSRLRARRPGMPQCLAIPRRSTARIRFFWMPGTRSLTDGATSTALPAIKSLLRCCSSRAETCRTSLGRALHKQV